MIDQQVGVYNTNSDIRFETTMLKSSLYDYNNAYILIKGTMTITGAGTNAAARQADERNKRVMFTNFAPFINRKTEIDNSKDIDIVMPMYNLIEYNSNYSKTSGRLWQYYKDNPNVYLADFESF